MKRFHIIIFLALLITYSKTQAQKTAFTLPEVNKVLKDIHIYINVELDDSTKSKIGFNTISYFNPLINYIDYNIIGRGDAATIHDDELRDFILKNAHAGITMKSISNLLVEEFVKEMNLPNSSDEKEDLFHVGGFFTTEFEHHQEDDGMWSDMLEVNNLKLFFASHINSKGNSNHVSVFAEYNPIPEEVIHQILQVPVQKGSYNDTLRELPIMVTYADNVPFERLFVNIKNVGGTKLGLTVGQFRLPFGIWNDYSSHRNFNSTKTNMLVNGYALRKIEVGAKLDYQINNNWKAEAAIVYGRQGRTAPIFRGDMDMNKDLVTHITYNNNRFTAGASAYLGRFSINYNNSVGIDLSYRFNKLLVSGEVVYQENKNVAEIYPILAQNGINMLSSTSAYAQFDYEISNKFHLFGLYDTWTMMQDGKIINHTTYRAFHGLKYILNPKVRWTIVEYGHMFFYGFNKGANHYSTQLEVNF